MTLCPIETRVAIRTVVGGATRAAAARRWLIGGLIAMLGALAGPPAFAQTATTTTVPIAEPALATEAAPAPAAPGPLADLPLPTTPAVPQGPKRIVVVGDNLAFGVARDLGEALDDIPDLDVERLAVGSSGLVRDDFYDWPAELKTILEEPTAAVVLIIGANDRQPLRDDKGSHQPNSDDWLRLYTERVEELAAIPKAAGVPLFWVEMPVMSSGSLTSTLTLTNAIFRDKTEAAGGTFVETWDQFVDESGKYSRSGPDLTGTQKRLRTGDGIHFTKAGYDVLAHVIAKPLRQLPALAVDPRRDQAEVEAMMLGSTDVPDQTDVPGQTGVAAAPSTGFADPRKLALRPADGAPEEVTAAAPPQETSDATAEPALPTDGPTIASIIGADEADPTSQTPDVTGSGTVPGADLPARKARPSVRQVRVERPFLLTQPGPGESALVTGITAAGPARRPSMPAPEARADSVTLPTY